MLRGRSGARQVQRLSDRMSPTRRLQPIEKRRVSLPLDLPPGGTRARTPPDGCSRRGLGVIFELRPLPYAANALEPYLGAETLRLHREKHHAGYLEELERLVGGKPQRSREPRDDRRDRDRAPVRRRRAGLEPRLPLAVDDTRWRRGSPGPARRGPRPKLRRRRRLPAHVPDGSGGALRLGLDLARAGSRAPACASRPTTRSCRCTRGQTPLRDARPLGARLLPRLPQRAKALRRGVPRAPDRLGLRRRQPRGRVPACAAGCGPAPASGARGA